MKDAALIYIATLVPVAIILLTACAILLANLDTYDPPEYTPPPPARPVLRDNLDDTVRLPVIRPVLIVDAYLGVFEAPATPAGTPEYNRLANRYALRQLGQMRELVAS